MDIALLHFQVCLSPSFPLISPPKPPWDLPQGCQSQLHSQLPWNLLSSTKPPLECCPGAAPAVLPRAGGLRGSTGGSHGPWACERTRALVLAAPSGHVPAHPSALLFRVILHGSGVTRHRLRAQLWIALRYVTLFLLRLQSHWCHLSLTQAFLRNYSDLPRLFKTWEHEQINTFGFHCTQTPNETEMQPGEHNV